MAVVEGIVADKTSYRKLSCYQKIGFPYVKSNKSIMLLNFLSKPGELVVTNDSKLVLIPDVKVPESVTQEAESAIHTLTGPVTSSHLTIDKILDLPEGAVFTVTAKITEVCILCAC